MITPECGDLETIRAQIVELSGSGKRVAPSLRKHGIYSSFTLPGLDDMQAVRDTARRISDFGVDEKLEGVTVLDVGSNVGALALELARRGAKVVGLEYRADRVKLCEDLATLYDLDASFAEMDFREAAFAQYCFDVAVTGGFDLVFCCSVDTYIDDRQKFYEQLRELTRHTLYLESNVQRDQYEYDTMAMLARADFAATTYLGNGHSGGVARKRKLFRAEVRR